MSYGVIHRDVNGVWEESVSSQGYLIVVGGLANCVKNHSSENNREEEDPKIYFKKKKAVEHLGVGSN